VTPTLTIAANLYKSIDCHSVPEGLLDPGGAASQVTTTSQVCCRQDEPNRWRSAAQQHPSKWRDPSNRPTLNQSRLFMDAGSSV